MNDANKSKSQLIAELEDLRLQIADLQDAEKELKQAEKYFRERETELSTIFYNAPIVMILVDSEGKVRRANLTATEFAGRSEEEMVGLRGGEALRCIHHLDDPQGCGFGPICQECLVRQTVLDTFETGKSHRQVKTNFSVFAGEKEEELSILVSSAMFTISGSEMVLVGIEDVTEHMRAQEELRKSKEQLQSILDNTSAVIYIKDIQGRYLLVNRRAQAATGLSRLEFIGRTDHDIFPKEVADRFWANDRNVIEAGAPVAFEEIVEEKNEIRTYVTIKFPLYDPQGDIYAVGGISTDITDRKRAEDALRESEERFRNLTENIPGVSIQGYGIDGTVFYWNKESEKVYGYTAEEAIGKNLADLIIPPDLLAHFKQNLNMGANITESGELMPPGELILLRKDGSLVPIYSIHTAVYIEGRDPMLFCIDVDLSERKRAEEALRESKLLLEKIFASLGESVFVVDPATRTIILCNQAVENIYGYDMKEVLGRNTEFLYADRAMYERFGQECFSALDKTGVFHTEFQTKRKDGSIIDTSHTVTQLVDESGHRTGIVSVVRDISARKNYEEKIQKAYEEMESRIEERTTELKEANTALRVLIEHLKLESLQVEKNIMANIEKLIYPYLDSLQSMAMGSEQQVYLNIIRENLSGITSGFADRLSSLDVKLTPAELKVADFLRQGKTSKEIAKLLAVSVATVSSHRSSIRKKLGIANKKVNLRSYLQSDVYRK